MSNNPFFVPIMQEVGATVFLNVSTIYIFGLGIY